ncbi:DUF1304 domain-containing protein [Carnobacterium maltaromaticum]|uniref:DUF1304 domain-containing protein n=1 Tax=Carnobacterium maltaromaticum TaxID=2751 RepID=A0AAW9K988_CARML|nr:DUF1304 domain-containing protein [Carnobacterium maltaromaticum]MDZ5758863.1 DUF1304 domain-containing protein [Carnobacterium maltaromaticum]
METVAFILVLIVTLEHVYIMALEMFFSTSENAQKTFGLKKEFLQQKNVKTLMANQGLYNGFLAAGLFWGLFFVPAEFALSVQLFFLGCVIVAAVYGSLTANKGILIKQGLPAILAFIFVLIS